MDAFLEGVAGRGAIRIGQMQGKAETLGWAAQADAAHWIYRVGGLLVADW